MKRRLVARLLNEVIHECGVCNTTKTLAYVMEDGSGDTRSICEECRDDILNGKGGRENDRE
jgi:hypothetical protein